MADYYTTLKRSMFRRVNEVGAKPFLLFQYYLTYQSASDGIRPSLKTTALDMGILDKQGNPQISAVCHLKKVLIEQGWIAEKDGEIIITLEAEPIEKISIKLRKSQQPVEETIEKISTKVEKISIEPLRKSQSPIYRNEKEEEKKEIIIKEKEIKTIVSAKPKPVEQPELISFRKTLSSFQNAYAQPTTKGAAIAQNKAIQKLFELARGDALSCIERHRFYQSQSWRNGRVDWNLVLKEFNFYGKQNNGSDQKSNGQYLSTSDKRLRDEIESEQLIRSLLGKAEQESVSSEPYRAIEAHTPFS